MLLYAYGRKLLNIPEYCLWSDTVLNDWEKMSLFVHVGYIQAKKTNVLKHKLLEFVNVTLLRKRVLCKIIKLG